MKNNNISFSFFITVESVMKEINNLNPRKACRDSDILTKITKKINTYPFCNRFSTRPGKSQQSLC